MGFPTHDGFRLSGLSAGHSSLWMQDFVFRVSGSGLGSKI